MIDYRNLFYVFSSRGCNVCDKYEKGSNYTEPFNLRINCHCL